MLAGSAKDQINEKHHRDALCESISVIFKYIEESQASTRRSGRTTHHFSGTAHFLILSQLLFPLLEEIDVFKINFSLV